MNYIGVTILVCLLVTTGYAAEPSEEYNVERTCRGWTGRAENSKISMIFGRLLAVESADVTTGDVIIPKLWPKGYRVGSVVTEVNAACRYLDQSS